MKFKTVILEDNLIAKITLENYCNNYPEIEFLESFETVQEAIIFVKKNTVDLVFLDIELKDDLGWELLSHIHDNTIVIVTTSQEKYLEESRKYDKISQFLLKPIFLDTFLMAMSKVNTPQDRP